jgi:hypothetical protein
MDSGSAKTLSGTTGLFFDFHFSQASMHPSGFLSIRLLTRILHENADNGVFFIKSVSEPVCLIGP